MSTRQVCIVSGDELVKRLSQLKNIGLTTVDRWLVNEAREERPIAEAQRVLERHGYYLSEWAMVEGDFYQLTYLPLWGAYPDMERWPYWVKLRYITSSSGMGPQLALSYYDHGVLKAYEGSYPRTYGTGSADAQRMLVHFEADHPLKSWKWLPIFDGHWPE